MGRRSPVGMLVAVGMFLAGCEEPAVAARAPGLEEAGPATGEGVGTTEWTRALVLGDSQAMRAAVAPNGDVLVVAAYGRPVDLGGGPLPFDRGAHGPHLLVARFSPEGALRWARGLVPRGAGAVRAQVGAVGTDSEGEVLLGGTSAGFQVGEGWLPEGPFLARLSPEGALTWVRTFPGEGPLTVGAVAVEAGSGDVVMVGDFAGQRDFGDGEHSVPVDRLGAFVARFSTQGAPRWSRAFGTRRGDVSARALAVDPSGAVVVAGSYSGAASFGGSTFVTTKARTPWVLKLSREGAHQWSREVPGADGVAQAVAVGADQVFVAGTYTGRFFFHEQSFESDWQDGFVATYDGHGRSRWARSFGASATALAADGAGQLLVAGTHDGGLDVGNRGWAPGLYVTKLLPDDGSSVWARGFVGTGVLQASTVAVDAAGHALVAGSLAGPRAPGSTGRDGFLLRLRP